MKLIMTLGTVAALLCTTPLYASSLSNPEIEGQAEDTDSPDNDFAKKYPYLSKAYDSYVAGNIPKTIKLLNMGKANGEDGVTLRYLIAQAYAETDSIFKAYDIALKLLNRDMSDYDYQRLVSQIVAANPTLGDLYFSPSKKNPKPISNVDSLTTIYEICSDGLWNAHYNTLAEKYARAAYELRPTANAAHTIALTLSRRQKFEEAIKVLDPHIYYCDYPSIDAMLCKSTVLRYMKQFDHLVEYLDTVASYVNSLDGNVFREMGLVKMEQGRAYTAMEPTPANLSIAVKYFNVAAGYFASAQADGYDERNILSGADADLRAGICLYRYGYKDAAAARHIRKALANGANKPLCYAYLGDAKKAKEHITRDFDHMNKAAIYYVLGDHDTAMKLLEEGFYWGELSPAAIETDPILAPLTKDPRYEQAAAIYNPR